MTTGPLIRLSHIERSYPLGKQQFFYVLRDINLEVAEGDFVSVMGPSGAGKSTLLHLLGMHDFGWTGEYYLNEIAVHRLKPKERTTLRNEQIGFVFQQLQLARRPDGLRKSRHPAFLSACTANRSAPRSWPTRSIVSQSSGKKISIRASFPAASSNSSASRARSSPSPKLILADEPTGNLHSSQGEEIMQLFKKLNAEGTTIIQVTHSEKNAAYGNRVIQLRDGWIVDGNKGKSS